MAYTGRITLELLTRLCVCCFISRYIILLNYILTYYLITLLNFLFFTLLGVCLVPGDGEFCVMYFYEDL